MERKDNVDIPVEELMADLGKAERDPEIIAEGTSGLKAEEEVKIVLDSANRLRQGVITGITPESTKLKEKMLTKNIKEKKVPEHIRKVEIIINDKKPNDPIIVVFAGDWSGSDLNLAGKHLILEYNLFVRNRAIRK